MSALHLVGLEFIYQIKSYQQIVKMVFSAFQLGTQHKRNSVENKLASFLVVSLSKTLYEMPPILCGRQVVGQSSSPVAMAQSN